MTWYEVFSGTIVFGLVFVPLATGLSMTKYGVEEIFMAAGKNRIPRVRAGFLLIALGLTMAGFGFVVASQTITGIGP